MSEWMTPKEAATYLGRQSKTAWRTLTFYARAGKIKAGHDGRTFRFKAQDLDEWLYLNAKERSRG